MMTDPELYRDTNAISRAVSMEIVAEYTAKIQWRNEQESVIDIGCADGSVSCLLKQQVPCKDVKFVACDISEVMIEFANENNNGKNITFRQLDISGHLPNDLKSNFNHAFSFFALNLVQNQEQAFQNIYDLIVRGGDCLLVIIQHVPWYYMLSYAAAQNSKWSSSWLKNVDKLISPYHSMQDPEEKIRQMMEKIGFVDIDVKRKVKSHVMKNGTEVKNFIKSVQPLNIPDDEYDQLALDCVPEAQRIGILDKTDKTFEDHKDPINYSGTVLIVYARK